MQVHITREQADAISVALVEYRADGALVTGGESRGDIFVALIDEDGSTNVASLSIDSLGAVDQEV